MDWTFKIRGEDVTYTILPETAVKLAAGSTETAPLLKLASFGDLIEDEPLDNPENPGSLSERDIFRRAGWHFVHPLEQVALAAETRSEVAGAAAVRQVIRSNTGACLIETGLATVRLNDDQSVQVLEEDGLSIVYQLGFAPKSFEVRLPSGTPLPEIIAKLQARTDRYLYAEPSLLQIINARSNPQAEPEFGRQWQHVSLGSLDAWQVTRGNRKHRVRVAVIDYGMEISHPDLADGIVGGGFFRSTIPGEAEFVSLPQGADQFPADHHGTFCLGLVGAKINGTQGCGLAPEAGLIPIACPSDQTATQTTLARAIEFAADPNNLAADVISCSLDTHKILHSNLHDAISFAANVKSGKGVPIFWAVTNTPTPIVEDKLFDHPALIAVGRHDSAGKRVDCGFGFRLEYLAPGQKVFSTGQSANFMSDDGTSFATPLAAAVAALVLSIQPDWTAEQVRNLLRNSCNPPGMERNDTAGCGLLSAAIAVTKAKPADL